MTSEILFSIIVGLLTIISYFLRSIGTDIKEIKTSIVSHGEKIAVHDVHLDNIREDVKKHDIALSK